LAAASVSRMSNLRLLAPRASGCRAARGAGMRTLIASRALAGLAVCVTIASQVSAADLADHPECAQRFTLGADIGVVKKCADLGFAGAECDYGGHLSFVCEGNNCRLAKDLGPALSWLEKSLAADEKLCRLSYAFTLENAGQPALAEAQYKKAVELGIAGSFGAYGHFLVQFSQAADRYQRAFDLFTSGYAAGDAHCATQIALLYLEQKIKKPGGDDRENAREAKRWLDLGIAGGDPFAKMWVERLRSGSLNLKPPQ
jgi:tetratricopeptide (TPR) repeat protein